MRQLFVVGRQLFGLALHFAFELVEHDKLVRLRILLRSIDLQIAQDKGAFPVLLKKNKWIADENPRRVKHVRVGLAGRDNQTRYFGVCCHVAMLAASGHLSSRATVEGSRCASFKVTSTGYLVPSRTGVRLGVTKLMVW